MNHDHLFTNRSEYVVSHRILDANLNRAFEGIRTLEDVARFHNLGDIQGELKSLRHRLRTASTKWNQELLLASRNADADVGRSTKEPAEVTRKGGLAEICQAASQRVQQSFRCLEEVSKFIYPESAAAIEAIRYQTYDLNARLLLCLQRDLDFLDRARLYVLADCQLPLNAFRQRVREISLAGVSIIQIRDKQCEARDLIQYTLAATESVDSKLTRIVVNDRADIACCARAWGLHVGQSDLSVAQSRSFLSKNVVLGLSTHNMAQVHESMVLKVDYIGCGPTFPSQTKDFQEFSGLEFLREAATALKKSGTRMPTFAIGGIDATNVSQVLDAGITRVAVSKSVWDAESPARATESIRSQLERVP